MLFLIPVAIGASVVLTGGAGAALGVQAAAMAHDANARRRGAELELEGCQERYRAAMREAVLELSAYGEVKSAAIQGPIARLRDYIVASGRRVSISQFEQLDDLIESLPDLDDPKLDADLVQMLLKLGIGVSAGTAARAGVFALVGSFGVASTGAPIAGLSGVAATNATMAAIGGGAVAAGGGGVALGGLLLGGLVAGPALLMVGLGMRQQAERYETSVAEFCAEVAVFAERTRHYEETQPFVLARIAELRDAATLLAGLLDQRMDLLQSRDLDDPRTHRDFAVAMTLGAALARLLRTPVFGADGSLNEETSDCAEDARQAAGAAAGSEEDR